MKNMKFIILIFFGFGSIISLGQNVGINGTGATPDPSAMLDVNASNKGLLIPNVALTALNVAAPIVSPATSLLVYNTATAGVAPNNVIPGYYYWNGSAWVSLSTTGQNSTTYFNSGAININNSAGYYFATGFPVTVTVPANCKTIITADIGLQFGANNVAADVFLIVDGAFLADGAYYRAGGSNSYGNNDVWERVNMTQTLLLSPGTHTIGIAGFRASGAGSFILGGDSSSVLQGEMTVTFLKL